MLEARPYLAARPLDGALAIETPALLCVHDGTWTCVESGPLGGGFTEIAPWSPGVWVLVRHRSEGTSYWSEVDDTLIAITLDEGGVTIRARMHVGVSYEGRDDAEEPLSGWGVTHPHSFRGSCVELGAPARRGRARRGRLPRALEQVNDDERELGEGEMGRSLDDRSGRWVLADEGFRRVIDCPSDVEAGVLPRAP